MVVTVVVDDCFCEMSLLFSLGTADAVVPDGDASDVGPDDDDDSFLVGMVMLK